MSRSAALGELSSFTVEQWGMVTAAQARSVGVSRLEVARLIGDGVLGQVDRSARVYRLLGAPADPDLEPVRAVWLQLGDGRPASARLRSPDAVVAGRSAAMVRDFGDLPAPVHDLYVTDRRQLRRSDLRLRVRSAGLAPSQWSVVDGLPVCSPARIVDDLLAAQEDGSAVARICQDAAAAGLLDQAGLAEILGRHAVAYGWPAADLFAIELLGQEVS